MTEAMKKNEEHVAFYYELGVTISQWAMVEVALLWCVTACLKHESEHKAVALGFMSIENFRSKLDFAEAQVGRTLVGTNKYREWVALVDKVRRASTKRNKLVHRQVQIFTENKAGRRWLLVPTIFRKTKKSKSGEPEDSIGVMNIIHYRYDFASCYVALASFSASLRGQRATFPISLEPPKGPQSIRNVARRIHEVLGHPQKSSRQKRREQDAANAAASLQTPLGTDTKGVDETPS
jgi:hypothetical protein